MLTTMQFIACHAFREPPGTLAPPPNKDQKWFMSTSMHAHGMPRAVAAVSAARNSAPTSTSKHWMMPYNTPMPDLRQGFGSKARRHEREAVLRPDRRCAALQKCARCVIESAVPT